MITLSEFHKPPIEVPASSILAVKISEEARTIIRVRAINEEGYHDMMVQESARSVINLLAIENIHMEIISGLEYRQTPQSKIKEEDLVELPI